MLNDSIFWIDVDKIKPNPYQPRRDFDEGKLRELAESIRQYGVLQPLVATRREIEKEDGGLAAEYELIAGERRLRASRIAGVMQVPVVIRTGTEEEGERVKLELAIIENVQREDLNPIDRARAFRQLVEEFEFTHTNVGKKIGKSREYVTNTIRLLSMPEDMIVALSERKINEGHTRPLLMLVDKPEEQMTLFKEIMYKKLSVREAERIARHTATERVRKKTAEFDPEFIAIEQKLTENLGTRVQIERREKGGKVTIDFLSNDGLRQILGHLEMYRGQEEMEGGVPHEVSAEEVAGEENIDGEVKPQLEQDNNQKAHLASSFDKTQDKSGQAEDDDLYSVRNFTI